MTTFAETSGKKTFDWNNFLDRAIAGDITHDEWFNATKLSENWITCACGNQCDIIPRNSSGEPNDSILFVYGVQFNSLISNYRYSKAKEVLAAIEQRSAELIKQIQNNI